MKILHITHYFLPREGGEERYAYYLGQELIERGHEMWVLTSSLPGCPPVEVIDNIKVVRFRTVATILRNPITPGMLLYGRRLPGFDLIHAQNEHSFITNAAVLLKHRLHLPLVLTCSGRLVFGNPLADAIERAYTSTIGKAILKSADRVIVLSLSEEQRLKALGVNKDRTVVIPTGLNLTTWTPYALQDDSDFLSKYHLNNRRVILFTGGITERKGIRYLIEAMPTVTKAHPDVICLLVGSGSYRGEAERLASELGLDSHIRFTGFVPQAELALAYKSCEVYVLPSLSEGLPATILEAFAFSKPVVATEIDGTVDYFRDVALLVPPRNSRELASELVRVLDNPALASDMGRRGRSLVESNFTWQQHVEGVLKLYEEAGGWGDNLASQTRITDEHGS